MGHPSFETFPHEKNMWSYFVCMFLFVVHRFLQYTMWDFMWNFKPLFFLKQHTYPVHGLAEIVCEIECIYVYFFYKIVLIFFDLLQKKSCGFLMNCLLTSNAVLMNFFWFSFEFWWKSWKFVWISYEFLMQFLCIWSAVLIQFLCSFQNLIPLKKKVWSFSKKVWSFKNCIRTA